MPNKVELIAELKAQGVNLTGKETVAELKALLPEKQKPSKPSENPPAPARTGQRSEGVEEASFQKTANSMKAMLDAQDKVSVYIPLEQGEPKGTQLPVEINGYRMNVPKGVPNVSVPKSVAEIIWQSLGVYEEASAALMSPNDSSRHVRLDLQSDADKSRLNA
jgi:hypothetical protein